MAKDTSKKKQVSIKEDKKAVSEIILKATIRGSYMFEYIEPFSNIKIYLDKKQIENGIKKAATSTGVSIEARENKLIIFTAKDSLSHDEVVHTGQLKLILE